MSFRPTPHFQLDPLLEACGRTLPRVKVHWFGSIAQTPVVVIGIRALPDKTIGHLVIDRASPLGINDLTL